MTARVSPPDTGGDTTGIQMSNEREENFSSLGNWVRERRRRLNLTQADLARKVGCAAITIRKIEQDERRPSNQIAKLLLEHLLIHPEERDAFLRLAKGEFVQIPAGVARPPRPPAFLDASEPEVQNRLFVAREAELRQLEAWLQDALQGAGRIGFVTGEAGHGKTSLLAEFARHAQKEHESLIVAGGLCSAFSGTGDPYLPFRQMVSLMVGDVEARWAGGTIPREQAVRLWHQAPFALQTLLADGQVLIDTLIPASLLARTAASHPNSPPDWREILKGVQQELRKRRDGEQRQLFEQFYDFLHRLAARRPLLLLLDDLQWADGATINLLFHLGRQLAGSRILILGAYRPSEIAIGRLEEEAGAGHRHPLEGVVQELKRYHGEIEINLSRFVPDEGQAFVDALINSEPNRLDERFRRALFWRTKGHPLFTVELLRALQEQGDLVRDESGRWQAIPSLSWDALPARVEAVIAQRIGRLDDDLRQLLRIASVEGEQFTAQVVALARQTDERSVVSVLSQKLANLHQLVRERDEFEVDGRFLARYQFQHALFQQYLYNSLSASERRLLHADIARALESLYGEEQEAIVVQLAYHYRLAGDRTKALDYARQAAGRAAAMYAFEEAVEAVSTALTLIQPGQQWEIRLALLEQLADLYVQLGLRTQAVPVYQEAIGLLSSLSESSRETHIRLHRKIGAAVTHMTWYTDRHEHQELARRHLEAGLALVEGQPASEESVRLLTALAENAWIGRGQPDWDKAENHARAATEMAEKIDAPVELSRALNTLAAVYSARGLLRERLEISLRRLELSRDPRFEDSREQADIYLQTGRAMTMVGEYGRAMPYFQQAEAISLKIQALDILFFALRYQAVCHFRLDNWDAVLLAEAHWHSLAQKYANFEERAGPTCFFFALVSAVQALRGNADEARRLREESRTVMIANDGPVEGWGRDNHY